ncbi:MAG: hypothetical protein J0L92_15500 [Deltaproteobacteria bacterium]|nr:hypothetical protein [Deltaproteobacteria bacterium]
MRGLPALGLRSLLVLSIALASVAMPRSAHAWTDATVRTARAEVELTDDGRAHVTLWARVRVDGGWLEGMELEGLDEDAVLDPERPLTFRDASGVALPVEVTPRDHGRVSLRFSRRGAPRRGEYDIDLAWTTSLASTRQLDSDTLEAHWVFPAWRYGLDAVEIRWIVPSASTPQPEDEITAPIEIETQPVQHTSALGSTSTDTDHVAIVYRRAHLPRTSDWDTVVRVPRAQWAHAAGLDLDVEASTSATPSSRTAPAAEADGTTAIGEDAPRRERWVILALAIALAALIKRTDLEARARRARQSMRWLLGTPRWLHALLAIVGAALAALTYGLAWDPSVCLAASALLVAITWQRAAIDPPRPRVMPLSPVSTRERVQAERAAIAAWIGPGALVEPARLGLATAGAATLIALESDAPARLLAALLVALITSGSRARIASESSVALRRLSRATRALHVDLGTPFVSLRLLGRGAIDPSDVRLHVGLSDEGARGRLLADLRVEVVATDGLALRLAAREETPADLALRAWAESEGVTVHDIARRRAVLVPVSARQLGPTLERIVRGILVLAPREQDATLREDAALDVAAE